MPSQCTLPASGWPGPGRPAGAVRQHLPVGWPPALWVPSQAPRGLLAQLGEPCPLDALLDGLADGEPVKHTASPNWAPQQPCGQGPDTPPGQQEPPQDPHCPLPALAPTAHPTEPVSAHLHCSVRTSATENAQDKAEGSHPDAPALHTWRVAASTDSRWGALSRGDLWGLEEPGGCIVSPQARTRCPLHTPSRDWTEKLPRLEGQEASPALEELRTYLCQPRSIPGKSRRRSHSLWRGRREPVTGPMAPSCLPGVHLNCDQDQVGHPYLSQAMSPRGWKSPACKGNCPVWTQDREWRSPL